MWIIHLNAWSGEFYMTKKIKITPDSTIPQVFKQCAQLYPERIAQIDGAKEMTYRVFDQNIDKLASGLLDLGIKPGEKVVIVLPSGNAFPVSMFAVIRMGGVSVGINPTLKLDEFQHILRDADAVAVIIAEEVNSADPLTVIREMRSELPLLRNVIVIGKALHDEINYYELIRASKIKEKYHQGNPDELAALIYTSGTTGVPKGSMHSHSTMLYPTMSSEKTILSYRLIHNIINRYGWNYVKRYLKVYGKPLRVYYSMPPYTGAGMMGVIGLFLQGQTVAHLDKFVPTKVLELIEKEKLTGIGLPPALGLMLIRNPKLADYDLSSLVFVLLGAAPVPPSLIKEFNEKLGCPVFNGFGATEIFGGPTQMDPFLDSVAAIRESVGKVKPNYEIRIVDEDRKLLPVGEVGELAIRTPIKMLGYYKADELTEQIFDQDGWYYTGDQAILDEDGYIRIVGRIRDMIIRGGQNIYPAELESVLLNHPRINQVAVIGVPDPIAGEKVLAFIIPEREVTIPTPVEILNFCREKMAAYKVPANIHFVDSFPLNATGKVLKRVLQEQAIKWSI
jgi:acyl-CoA synthetase (AMP-forming)/AMP-acid ligase II